MCDEKFTVIFLINNNPPAKVLLLKRAATKSFAPNYFTGIGGKVGDIPENSDESVLEGAYRELSEETEENLSKEIIKLRGCARCVLKGGIRLHYFWGEYFGIEPPRVNPLDGTLVWVAVEELLQRNIIPTTRVICKEWAQRGFKISCPFTVYVREIGMENTVRLVEVQKVEDELC